MTIKTIQVAELKAHLSQYLRRAQKGERIVVLDRQTPIAELVPLKRTGNVWERLAAERGLRLGTASRAPFTPSPRGRRSTGRATFLKCRRTPVSADPAAIYVDTSAILRILFGSAGAKAPLTRSVTTSSQLVEVEAYRVVDRLRLAGGLTDLETARKHRELRSLLD